MKDSASGKETEQTAIGLPGIYIPGEVLFHPSLTLLEKILFGILQNLSHTSDGCWASNRYLGNLFGVTPQTISKSISSLVDYKLILVEYAEIKGKIITKKQVRKIWINPGYKEIYEGLYYEAAETLTKSEEGLKEIFKHKGKSLGVLRKILSPPLRKTLTKYNKEYNNKESSTPTWSRSESLSNSSNKNSIEETLQKKKNKNNSTPKKYLILARRLSEIIRQQKNIQHSTQQINSWAKEIRKLETVNKIPCKRISAALKWYQEYAGGQYVPVIESGASFRNKFLKLEAAMKRETSNPATSYHRKLPAKPNKDILFQLKKAKPVCKPAINDYSDGELYYKLEAMETTLVKWEDKVKRSYPEKARKYPTASRLINEFIAWCGESKWVDSDITMDRLCLEDKLFRAFLRDYQRRVVGWDYRTGRDV